MNIIHVKLELCLVFFQLTSLNVQFRTNESQDVFEELKGLLGQPIMVYMNEDK